MFLYVSEMIQLLSYTPIMLIQIAECKTIYLSDHDDCWPNQGVTEVRTTESLRIEWRGKHLNFHDFTKYCTLHVRMSLHYDFKYNYQLCYNLKKLRVPCGQKLEFYDTDYFWKVDKAVADRTYSCRSFILNENWCGEEDGASFKLFTKSNDVSPSRYNMILEVSLKKWEKPKTDDNEDDDEDDNSTTYIILAGALGLFVFICCCVYCSVSSKQKDITDKTSEGACIPLQAPYPVSTEGAVMSVPEPSTTWDPVTQQEVIFHPLVTVHGTTGNSDDYNVSSHQQSYLGLDSNVTVTTAPEWEPTDQPETTGTVRNFSVPPPKYTDLFPEQS